MPGWRLAQVSQVAVAGGDFASPLHEFGLLLLAASLPLVVLK
jgi:hypothetical protein